MPANLPPEYYKLEDEYSATKSREGRIKILEKMLSVIPSHKASQKVRGEIRRKISILKKEIDKEALKKRGSRRKGIKKEGAAQVCLLGKPNSGKSYILNKLCNKNLKSTSIPFETKTPEVAMLDIDGIQIQLIEIPSVYEGFYEKCGEFRSLIYTCDLICFVIKNDDDLNFLKSEIGLDKQYISIKSKDFEFMKQKIWNKLNLIKVYTKEPGKDVEKTPIAMKENATVGDIGEKIHKDFIDKFKFAKIYRKEAKVQERRVGLKFNLKNNDVVEFHTK